jgi:hypothetical protein
MTRSRPSPAVSSGAPRRVALLLASLFVSTWGCSEESSPTDPLPVEPAALPVTSHTKIPLALQKPFDRSDYISQHDIEKAGGRYKLPVDGVGDLFVQEIRAPEGAAKQCLVNKQSLAELARAAIRGGSLSGPTWLRMNLFVIPELDLWICFGLGAGCYIIISPH